MFHSNYVKGVILLVFCVLKVKVNAENDKNEIKDGCGYRNKRGAGNQYSGARENEAQFGEFPWILAIFEIDSKKAKKYICGGSLIHPQIVLSAAHCIPEKNADRKLKVRAGAWDMELFVEILPYQDNEVQDVIKHPEYIPQALYNDIALLILKLPFILAEHINTVCLPPQNYVVEDSERGFSMGWGRFKANSTDTAIILKKVDLPVVSREDCEEKLRKTRLGASYRMHESFMCAGGEEGQDTCKGDGGNPLVFPVGEDPNRYFQGGIVAWGIGCWEKNNPGVYVNVPKFRNWIDDQLRERNFNTSAYQYQAKID